MKAIYRIMALSLLFLGLAACKEKMETPQSLADIKITTTEVTNITANSAVSGGEITDNGGYTITKRGVCWGTAENPTMTGDKTTDGSGDGAFTSTITGIEPAKTYHVRAYALCAAGVAYGNDVTFSVPVFEPSVKTGLVTDLGMDFAVIAGEVLSANGGAVTEVGVLYGPAANPTTKVAAAQVADNFTVELKNLTENTEYYVKAYAVNEAGTGYGEEITFTTSADPVLSFADANLQDYMSFTYGDTDGNLRKSVADTITILDIANQGIASLEGIKNLKNLKKLVANNNPLAAADLSDMTSLEYVDIGWGKVALNSVNIDGCTALKVFTANDPLDGTCPESFAPNAPALEDLNLNVWRTLKTLDLSKCVNLKNFWGCQMYVVEAIDLTYSEKLENVWIPDIFAATSFKISSPVLWYLGMWNAKALTKLDLSNCPVLQELQANDSYEIEEFKINCPQTMRRLNINCFRKITSLDLTDYVNLESLDAIQMYVCDFKLPSDLSKCKWIWLADLLVTESLTFKNVPADARVLIWNCPALKTFNYETAQEVVAWNYGDSPTNVADVWASPGVNITSCNIKAPNAKRLYISNLHALPSLDLSQCPNLEYVCMPDLWVMTSLTLPNTNKLNEIWMWSCRELGPDLNLKGCADVIKELNIGTGDGACTKIQRVLLRTGQSITTIFKEPGVELVYE